MVRHFPVSTVVLRWAAIATGLVVWTGCPTPTPQSSQCTTDDNTTLEEGEQTLAADGCNVCTCRSGTLNCTRTACEPPPARPDGGTPDPDSGPGDGGPGGDDDAGPPPDIDAGPPPSRPDNCVDEDGDGYYRCRDESDPTLCDCTDPNYPLDRPEIDCDDSRWFVQPGGYEYPDNEIDDNCNDLVDAEEVVPCGCNLTDPSVSDLAAAMELCDETILTSSFDGDLRQASVFESYFGDIPPQDGTCYTVLSTGIAGSTDINLNESLCNCSFGLGCEDDPDPIDPDINGVCDLGAIQLTLAPPKNARGFEFEFMFLSAEWPEFLCQDFNDTFYTIVETQAVAGGERSNISFDPEQREITVNVGFFEAPRQWSTDLSQTPFGAEDSNPSCGTPLDDTCALPGYCPSYEFCETPCDSTQSCVDLDNSGNYGCFPTEAVDLNHAGSGSGWLVTRAPISPDDETITVTFSVHDEGDGIYDSLVILDSFRWVPYTPVVGTTPKD